MSAPVNSRKKTATARTKRPYRFLMRIKPYSAFIDLGTRKREIVTYTNLLSKLLAPEIVELNVVVLPEAQSPVEVESE